MDIVTILEEINLKLRNDEAQANAKCELAKALIGEDKLYKNQFKRGALERFVNENLLSKEQCSITDIASLAKFIVTHQIFIDGNHRTGLLACYLLSLELCSELLKIKPLYLYAAIDFEYLKYESNREKMAGYALFEGNAIELAIRSRSIRPIYSEALKARHYANIYDITCNLGSTMRELRDEKHPSPAHTTQKRLFRAFAGFREDFCHSTSYSIEAQIRFAEKEAGLNKPYSPPVFHRSSVTNSSRAKIIASASFSSIEDTSCALKSNAIDENESTELLEIIPAAPSSKVFSTISPSRNRFFSISEALIGKASPCSVDAMISPITTSSSTANIVGDLGVVSDSQNLSR